MTNLGICGRAELARILRNSESTTRNLEKAGLITPVAVIGGRPLFRIEEAEALRAKRDAEKRGVESV